MPVNEWHMMTCNGIEDAIMNEDASISWFAMIWKDGVET